MNNNYEDFELDIQLDRNAETKGGWLPNTKFDCVTLSIQYCTKITKINSCTCPSCWCSPTDMGVCDNKADGAVELRRC